MSLQVRALCSALAGRHGKCARHINQVRICLFVLLGIEREGNACCALIALTRRLSRSAQSGHWTTEGRHACAQTVAGNIISEQKRLWMTIGRDNYQSPLPSCLQFRVRYRHNGKRLSTIAAEQRTSKVYYDTYQLYRDHDRRMNWRSLEAKTSNCSLTQFLSFRKGRGVLPTRFSDETNDDRGCYTLK
jgi:hypothetical protein